MKNKDVITEIYEEELNISSEEDRALEEVEELKSKKANIKWVLDSDVLEEIEIGVESNIFTQVSIRITPAMYLAKIGRTKALYELIKRNPSLINQTTSNGRTPLMFAAQFGNINCLKLLIIAGAKINAIDEHGTTALMLASFFGQDEAVSVLLESGASKIIKDCNGVTARMLANKNEDKLICKILDEFHSDISQIKKSMENSNISIETLYI
ncbi:MAG: ankyrin repeat domain-containing protein [Mycoplasmoidaceae bacterium]